MPLALLSLWAGMRRKPWISMLSACFASIPHALIGLETGAIAIATAGVIEVLDCWREKKSFKTIMVRIRPALMAGIAFLLFGYFFWIRRVMLCLDDDLFIHLLTFVRAPHHYTPSYFRRLDWLALIVFLISSYLSWSWWRKKDQPSKIKSDSFLIPIVLILILLFGGYVFVELIPIRIWVSAQIYRLVYIIKWLGLILIGRSIALWVSQLSSSPRSGLSSILALIGNGRAQPLVLFAAHVWQWIKEQTALKRFPVLTAVIGVILVLTSLASLVFYGNLLEFAFMMLFLMTLLIIVKVRRTGWRRIVMLSIIGLLTFTVLQLRTTHPAWMNLARITIEDGDDPIDKVARFAKEHTPVDALFLCPPRCGRFRIVAERGIVIDFISFVIADEAMQSWYNRILDCYGEAEAPGFEGARELDQQYHQISESKIHYLAANYGASHAVLYKDTPCAFPVLYEDEIYKLVRIE